MKHMIGYAVGSAILASMLAWLVYMHATEERRDMAAFLEGYYGMEVR